MYLGLYDRLDWAKISELLKKQPTVVFNHVISSSHVSCCTLASFLQSTKRTAQGGINQRRCVFFFCAPLLVSKHGLWETVHALHRSTSSTIDYSLLNICYLYLPEIFEGHDDWFPVQYQRWEGMGLRMMVVPTRGLILGQHPTCVFASSPSSRR